MKSLFLGATALFLYLVFFAAVCAVGAWRAIKGQPSPFETEEDGQ